MQLMLANRKAYRLSAAVIGLGLFASNTPSPLYHTYSTIWHFSPLTLTLIYATYAFGVLATLLLAGRASDEVGRRPVLLAALGLLMASTVLFMLARSAAWLFAARGLQGLATGAAISAASAALIDLHPRHDPSGVGLTNGVASAAGLGLGALSSSAIVELGYAPRILPYVVLFALFALAFAGVLRMPESVQNRRRFRLTFDRPHVPSVARRRFALASLAVLSSWSIGGLFFSIGPQLGAHLFASGNALVDAIGIVTLAGAAALSQLVLGRTSPWVGASAGSIALAAGMLLIIAAAETDSSVAYVVGTVVAGAGFGIAFLGGLRALVAVIPPEQRAATMAAFYIVAYASLSVPAVLAGVVVTHLGLDSTFELFGSIAAALALVVAFEAWRTRPRPLGAQPELAREPRATVRRHRDSTATG